ncbi:MAG: hypothetical protein V3T83_08020, partial [Acidobacteriota bacterium]
MDALLDEMLKPIYISDNCRFACSGAFSLGAAWEPFSEYEPGAIQTILEGSRQSGVPSLHGDG